jgi:hypothetical protein
MSYNRDYSREFKITGGIPEAYKIYKKERKLEGKKVVSKQIYSDICHEFNKRISDKIVRESYEFKIPFGLGYLRIKCIGSNIKIRDGKLLPRKSAPNWAETKKLWYRLYPDKTWEEIRKIPNKKIIIHTNEHTDGKVMRFYWDKRLNNFTNKTAYCFMPVKGVQEADYYENDNCYYYGRLGLAKWIKNNRRTNEYYE